MSPALRQRVKWWMAPIGILALSAIAIAAILLFKPQSPGEATPVAAKWDVDCGADKASDFKCFQKHYQAMIAGQGVPAAFADIKDAYEKSPFVKSNCHQLIHVVGRAAGDKYGDVAKAYEHGDDFCWSGYYHGVMESVLTKIGFDKVKEQIGTICAGVSTDKKYSFYHYNCVHGLGHGVMAVHHGELFEALGTCDNLTDGWESSSCHGGVFMENIMAEINPDHSTKYLKNDDLMYPCTAVQDRHKLQCYLMQTSHALQVTGYDFDKVFGLCDKVESGFRPTCYQSLGRDASGSTISDTVRTRDICMKGRDFDARSNCIVGAVKDFVAYFHSNAKGDEFCAAVDAVLRESCLSAAKSMDMGS